MADYVGDRRSGINQAVVDEVQSVFRGKTLQQLELLEKTIRNKLHGGEGVDIGTTIWHFYHVYVLVSIRCMSTGCRNHKKNCPKMVQVWNVFSYRLLSLLNTHTHICKFFKLICLYASSYVIIYMMTSYF